MRIAFLTSEYVTEKNFDGGLAQYLSRVAGGLSLRGHEVEIFVRSDVTETVVMEGVTVHRLRWKAWRWRVLNRLTAAKLLHSIEALALSHALAEALKARHRKKPFDVVQASSYSACGLFASFDRSLPVVVRISSYEPAWRQNYRRRLSVDQRLAEELERQAMAGCRALYAPSRLLADICSRAVKRTVEVIRPPFMLDHGDLDVSVYERELQGKKYLLFFGTLGLLKGGEALAQSLPGILRRYGDMYFVFAGKVLSDRSGGDMLDHIRREAGDVAGRIIALGVLPQAQLRPVIERAQGVVLPSLVDNLPNALLESMALGKVVIGTRGASFDEMIEDGVSGRLVGRDAPGELSAVMEQVWNMPEADRQRIGAGARERIAALSPELSCARLEEFFEKAKGDL
jgi:glycosyltransferase involved in cell wall biosynthesis